MSGNRVITVCNDLKMYWFSSAELMEEANNNPRYKELGSIEVRLDHRFEIRHITMNRDDWINQDDYTTKTMVPIESKELHFLCDEEFTERWVNRMFNTLQVNSHEESIYFCKAAIVKTAVQWAKITKSRGLKQFGFRVYIKLTTTREIVREREELDRIRMVSEEKILRGILLRSMEEKKLKRNPLLKRCHFEDGGVMKDCVVCLDDFEIGSEVIWMSCSHMFHEGCLLGWLKENKSCPLCRLKLTP